VSESEYITLVCKCKRLLMGLSVDGVCTTVRCPKCDREWGIETEKTAE